MALWDNFRTAFRDTEKRYKTPFLTRGQVDVDYDDRPVEAGEAYCRIWLVEMRLAQGVAWFRTRYPAVYAATRYDYGGKPVTVPFLGGLDYFKGLTQDNLDRVIQLNRPLTPLFPFNRGTIDLQVGLFSMIASDPIARFLGVLGRLSSMLPVPELSSVINLVEPIYNGIEELFDAGEGNLELGYQQAFTAAGGGGGNSLRPGYFAAIMAQGNQIDETKLRVISDGLRILGDGSGGAAQPLTGYDYMLFRIEKQPQQDWESLNDIKGLVERAQSALELGKSEVAQDLLASIKVAVYRSPDIAKADRTGMFTRIREHLGELGLQAAQGRVTRQSLYAIMQRPMPAMDAATRAEVAQLEEVFGEG
jgi:hypothetical protein